MSALKTKCVSELGILEALTKRMRIQNARGSFKISRGPLECRQILLKLVHSIQGLNQVETSCVRLRSLAGGRHRWRSRMSEKKSCLSALWTGVARKIAHAPKRRPPQPEGCGGRSTFCRTDGSVQPRRRRPERPARPRRARAPGAGVTVNSCWSPGVPRP